MKIHAFALTLVFLLLVICSSLVISASGSSLLAPPAGQAGALTLAPASGLSIEEHALRGSPSVEPLTFTPAEGSQQDVLQRHASQRNQRIGEPLAASERSLALGADKLVARVVLVGRSQVSVQVSRNETLIYQQPLGISSPIPNLWGFWVYDNHWVLEVAHTTEKSGTGDAKDYDVTGEVIRDGISLNQEYGYQESFGFQLLNGRPFSFFRKQSLLGVSRHGFSFDGQEVDIGYSDIPHYGCCSAAALNPLSAPSMVAFFAQRNGTWYYTEIGAFSQLPP